MHIAYNNEYAPMAEFATADCMPWKLFLKGRAFEYSIFDCLHSRLFLPIFNTSFRIL